MTSVSMVCFAAIIGVLVWQAWGNPCYNEPDGSGRCGPANNYTGCNPGQCCSQYAWCGSTDDHCNANSICGGESLEYEDGDYSDFEYNDYDNDDVFSVQMDFDFKSTTGIREAAPAAFNYCGRNKVVALSFDDGPNTDGSTEAVLRDLKAFGIKASFYLTPFAPLATPRDRELQCSLVERMLNEGHGVYSHSFSHPDFTLISDYEMRYEIDRFNQWFKECTYGARPPPVQVRPPYGELTSIQRQVLNQLGLTVATWNIDSGDWKGGSAKQVFDTSMEQFSELSEGSSALILLHDHTYGEGGSLGVIEMYYNAFKRMGYRFVTAEECSRLCALANDCAYPKWPGVFP